MSEQRPEKLRLTRRRLIRAGGLLSGAALTGIGLLACRSQPENDPTPAQTPATAVRPTSTSTVPRVTPTPVASTPTATSTRTPSPVVTSRTLYQGQFMTDPVSHDFNADLNCGGDPSLWSGLLRLNAALEPEPDWAASWEADNDATRWTFHLRRINQGWSNGDPVTAHDFIWSWQRLLSPELGASHAWMLYDIRNAEAVHRGELPATELGLTAIDDWTLEVQLNSPTAYFPQIVASVAGIAVHRPSVEAYGTAWTEAGNCVSNGPFRLNSWEHGVAFETTRNPNYWDGDVTMNATVAPIIRTETALERFDAGDVDYVEVSPQLVQAVQQNLARARDLRSRVEQATWFLVPDQTSAPFDDTVVRKAVFHAIDRERLVQITRGQAQAAVCLMPAGVPGYISIADTGDFPRFDVDLALSLLEGTEYQSPENWPVIHLAVTIASETEHLIAHDIGAQLTENLGVPVEVIGPEQDIETQDAGRLRLIRWEFSYADPNNGYADALMRPGVAPAPVTTPIELERLIEQAGTEADPTLRAEIYRECERWLQDDGIYLPLAYPTSFHLVQPWVVEIPSGNSRAPLLPEMLFRRFSSTVRIENRPEN